MNEDYLAKVLVLGSGMVSKPGVEYLLNRKDIFVTVASNEMETAQRLVKGRQNGEAVFVDASDARQTALLIKQSGIVVSLLPRPFHADIAKLCLEQNKHLVTASYADENMRRLDNDVRANGLLFLNEMGVDPGIDHMSAMKIIDVVEAEGGKVIHFYSFCGGLPAPDDNDNPFGYKFSWSPKGVLTAGRNPARYLENGQLHYIDKDDLFLDYRIEEVEGLGGFEVYPNRDSLPYKEIYGLDDAETVMRGTYRYPGWCDTFKMIIELGLVEDKPLDGIEGLTYKQLLTRLASGAGDGKKHGRTANCAESDLNSRVMQRLKWLGLFSDEIIPPYSNTLDILTYRMQGKMFYKEGEKDMLLMRHRFIVQNKDKSCDVVTSTMIEFGIPGGDSAMSRTVSLPLAIGVRLMAERKIDLTGVRIPIQREIYEPVLEELNRLNIRFTETRVALESVQG